ncbi:uncharacterized protein [Epargyreus clarus]|uniref:uncharacterized protein n=1 Tax=Epargyreus clarus TaxID=520877 RepID=UPI003C2BC38B
MLIEFIKMRRAGSPELQFGGPPFFPHHPQPEDSGIDSDDTTSDHQPGPENENGGNASDSSSSDDDPAQRSPGVRYLRVTNGDNVIEAVRLNPSGRNPRLPFLIPPIPIPVFPRKPKDGYKPVNQSPERSSSPLFEVELTASEEDDDASLLELVIPAPPSRYVRVPTSPTKANPTPPCLFRKVFCCLRR